MSFKELFKKRHRTPHDIERQRRRVWFTFETVGQRESFEQMAAERGLTRNELLQELVRDFLTTS